MSGVLLRLLVLAVVLGLAFAAAQFAGRSTRRARRAGLGPGITVVTGPDCRRCAPTVAALRAAAPGVPLRVRPLEHEAVQPLAVRSLPTVVLVDPSGDVVLRRTGHSALAEAERVARRARALFPAQGSRRPA